MESFAAKNGFFSRFCMNSREQRAKKSLLKVNAKVDLFVKNIEGPRFIYILKNQP